MSETPFQAGGPLMADSPSYILRHADQKTKVHLGRMEYMTFIEPRQSGKTSLINRLYAQFSLLGYDFALRDLGAAKSRSTVQADWYFDLGTQLIGQLRLVPPGGPPTDSTSWERFLVEVAKQAQEADRRLVIVLDEIGALPSDLATAFFSVIRSVYSTRQIFPYYRHLTFLIAGTFDPRMLIQDKSVSDFNIDQRIQLEDFSPGQLRELVSLIGLPEALTNDLAARIYHWSDGQPYVCQWLCLMLYEQKDSLDIHNAGRLVDEGIARFLQEETQHVTRIKELLARPELLAKTRQLVAEPRMKFSAGVNDDHFHLSHVLGIIKADSAGLCKIRNRVYERALAEAGALNEIVAPTEAPTPEDGFIYDVFISYSHKDVDWVRNRLLPYLDAAGVSVCIDSRNFKIGALVLDNMETAISQSRKILLVITPRWVGSVWTAFESALIQTQIPLGGRRRILPLILESCPLPPRLDIFTHLDLTHEEDFDSQMTLLLLEIQTI